VIGDKQGLLEAVNASLTKKLTTSREFTVKNLQRRYESAEHRSIVFNRLTDIGSREYLIPSFNEAPATNNNKKTVGPRAETVQESVTREQNVLQQLQTLMRQLQVPARQNSRVSGNNNRARNQRGRRRNARPNNGAPYRRRRQ